jgi:hypothetical protein
LQKRKKRAKRLKNLLSLDSVRSLPDEGVACATFGRDLLRNWDLYMEEMETQLNIRRSESDEKGRKGKRIFGP